MVLAGEQKLKKFQIKKPANSVFDWILTFLTQIHILANWWRLTFKWNVTGTKNFMSEFPFCIINLNSKFNFLYKKVIQENSAKLVFSQTQC